MKILLLLLMILVFTNCSNTYENEELLAIQDVMNEYLVSQDLNDNLNPPPPPPPFDVKNDRPVIKKINIDSLNLKVYVSSGLIPISQIKEDDSWLFTVSLQNKFYDSIYNSIIGSKKFNELGFKKINKKQIKFVKPYYQIFDKENEVGKNENYVMFKLSRVCFNSKHSYGVIFMEFERGTDSYYGTGELKVFLIQKQNNKWKLIKRK